MKLLKSLYSYDELKWICSNVPGGGDITDVEESDRGQYYKNFIDYLEQNNMSSEINTLLKMGSDLSDFPKASFRKTKSDCYNNAVGIVQLTRNAPRPRSLEDVMLTHYLENEVGPQLTPAFLKGWEVAKEVEAHQYQETQEISQNKKTI